MRSQKQIGDTLRRHRGCSWAREGRFFHGYYDTYCYLPLYVFCRRHLVAAKLRPANIDGSAGTVDELARIVAQIRTRWPEVRIVLRADSGFARDAIMAWCEANDVDFRLGLARNSPLVGQIAEPLAAAAAESLASGRSARRFTEFVYATRDSWTRERRVIATKPASECASPCAPGWYSGPTTDAPTRLPLTAAGRSGALGRARAGEQASPEFGRLARKAGAGGRRRR